MPSRSPAARLDGDLRDMTLREDARARRSPPPPHARWCCHHQSTTSMEYEIHLSATPWFSGVGPPSATCCERARDAPDVHRTSP